MQISRFLLGILLGLLLNVCAIAMPLAKIQWQAKPGTISLTFDDGPNPKYTPQILTILKREHIHATFFVLGLAARKYPNLIKQIVADGNAVASHTMSHPKLTRLSSQKLAYEIIKPKQIIEKIIGKPPVCVRPPFGMGNERVAKFIASQGMKMVPMGFNSFDYQQPGVQKIAQWVIKHARSGMVVLLHDGPRARAQTVSALPIIIAGVRKKGLGFSAICYP